MGVFVRLVVGRGDQRAAGWKGRVMEAERRLFVFTVWWALETRWACFGQMGQMEPLMAEEYENEERESWR